MPLNNINDINNCNLADITFGNLLAVAKNQYNPSWLRTSSRTGQCELVAAVAAEMFESFENLDRLTTEEFYEILQRKLKLSKIIRKDLTQVLGGANAYIANFSGAKHSIEPLLNHLRLHKKLINETLGGPQFKKVNDLNYAQADAALKSLVGLTNDFEKITEDQAEQGNILRHAVESELNEAKEAVEKRIACLRAEAQSIRGELINFKRSARYATWIGRGWSYLTNDKQAHDKACNPKRDIVNEPTLEEKEAVARYKNIANITQQSIVNYVFGKNPADFNESIEYCIEFIKHNAREPYGFDLKFKQRMDEESFTASILQALADANLENPNDVGAFVSVVLPKIKELTLDFFKNEYDSELLSPSSGSPLNRARVKISKKLDKVGSLYRGLSDESKEDLKTNLLLLQNEGRVTRQRTREDDLCDSGIYKSDVIMGLVFTGIGAAYNAYYHQDLLSAGAAVGSFALGSVFSNFCNGGVVTDLFSGDDAF